MPGADPGLITVLAEQPAAEVDLIVAALRQAGSDAPARDKARWARRRRERPKPGTADRSLMILRALRAMAAAFGDSGDVGEVRFLAEIEAEAGRAIGQVYAEMHSAGMSYGVIAAEVGVTRSAVHQRVARHRQVGAGEIGCHAQDRVQLNWTVAGDSAADLGRPSLTIVPSPDRGQSGQEAAQ